jgi:hypothetical protein
LAVNGNLVSNPLTRSQRPGGSHPLRNLIHAADEFYYKKLFKVKNHAADDQAAAVQTEHLEMIQFKIGDENGRVENTEYVGLKENPEVLFKKEFDCDPDNEHLDSRGNQLPFHPIPRPLQFKSWKGQ